MAVLYSCDQQFSFQELPTRRGGIPRNVVELASRTATAHSRRGFLTQLVAGIVWRDIVCWGGNSPAGSTDLNIVFTLFTVTSGNCSSVSRSATPVAVERSQSLLICWLNNWGGYQPTTDIIHKDDKTFKQMLTEFSDYLWAYDFKLISILVDVLMRACRYQWHDHWSMRWDNTGDELPPLFSVVIYTNATTGSKLHTEPTDTTEKTLSNVQQICSFKFLDRNNLAIGLAIWSYKNLFQI